MTQIPEARRSDRDTGANVEVVLEGGPTTLPSELRTRRVSTMDEPIKLQYYGGYEHFEWDGALDRVPHVFRWTRRTRIAE